MRTAAAIVGLLLVAGPVTSRAQPFSNPDGFSICPYAAGKIGACAPLTETAMQDYRLSAAQAGIVATLRNFAVKPETDLLEAIVNTKLFATPRKFAAAGEYTDYWFPDPSSANAECGVHFRYAKADLLQMSYAVDRNFIVIWNSVAVAPPR